MRHGNAFGTLYWKGIPQNTTPVRIRNGSKRGIWRYDVNGSTATLDNGLSFTASQLNAYRHLSLLADEQLQQSQQNTQANWRENNPCIWWYVCAWLCALPLPPLKTHVEMIIESRWVAGIRQPLRSLVLELESFLACAYLETASSADILKLR